MNTTKKLYWVVDLQDWTDVRILTLDEAKEHLQQFWDEEDYESDEDMNQHNQAIENADADELTELLLGIDWTLFKTQKEYEEHALIESRGYRVKKLLEQLGYEYATLVGNSHFADEEQEGETMLFNTFEGNSNKPSYIKADFLDEDNISLFYKVGDNSWEWLANAASPI